MNKKEIGKTDWKIMNEVPWLRFERLVREELWDFVKDGYAPGFINMKIEEILKEAKNLPH